LRDKALSEPRILEDIAHICNHYISDPYEQRYHFWMRYVTKRLSNN
jgi:hypothetical protein